MVCTNATPNPSPANPPAVKKPKEPALEDKPLQEFVQEHFLPNLDQALKKAGLADVDLQFIEQALPLTEADPQQKYWQVIGTWRSAQRQFNLYFLSPGISGPKAFSCSSSGVSPSTLESFMIDERKVSLDLMVLYTLQRLNGQKWLYRN